MRSLLVCVILSIGCGGRVDGPVVGTDGDASAHRGGSDGGGDDGGGGGTSPWDFPVCPPDPPSVGTGCTTPNQGCRYIQIGGGCEAYRCDGTWRSAPEGC